MGNKDTMFPIMPSPNAFAKCKSSRTGFSGFDWLEKRNALQNMGFITQSKGTSINKGTIH